MSRLKIKAIKKISLLIDIIRFVTHVVVPMILVLYVLLNLFLFLSQTQKIIPYSMFAVVSDSMIPAFYKDDLLITQNQKSYAIGDIITYKSPIEENKYISHRIVELTNTGYYTKGDNKPTKDIWLVTNDSIIGKTTYIANDLGFLISFPQSLVGSIIFLIIPCSIIIFSLIQNYWKNITKFIDKYKKEP